MKPYYLFKKIIFIWWLRPHGTGEFAGYQNRVSLEPPLNDTKVADFVFDTVISPYIIQVDVTISGRNGATPLYAVDVSVAPTKAALNCANKHKIGRCGGLTRAITVALIIVIKGSSSYRMVRTVYQRVLRWRRSALNFTYLQWPWPNTSPRPYENGRNGEI